MNVRGLLAGLLISLSTLTLAASNALILIQHDAAGPNLPSADYVHPEWIRWPADQGAGIYNRILALASGSNLCGELLDAKFSSKDGQWFARNAVSLGNRGFFEARRSYLGPLTVIAFRKRNALGTMSPSVLLLALSDPKTPVVPMEFGASLPDGSLAVAEAGNWDDAVFLASHVSGRTLIVEYPPSGSDGWSRFWLRGAWPSGVPVDRQEGVPGLVDSSRALAMLLRPSEFQWMRIDAGLWGGPVRWLEHGRDISPGILSVWFVLSAMVLVWAFAQVMNEDRGPFVSELLVSLALSPAAMIFAGAMARLGGLEAWPIWIVLSSGLLYGLSLIAGLIARRRWPDAHPLWMISIIGLIPVLALGPIWSDLSNRFTGFDVDFSGSGIAAAVAYFAGVVVFAPDRWLGRALTAAALIWGVTARPWWVGNHAALLTLPAAVLVASEGLFSPMILAALAFLPSGLWHVLRDGIVWNPLNLYRHTRDSDALNLWWHATLIVSPGWIATSIFVVTGLLLGNRFLSYRLGKLLRSDPRLRAFPWVAASVFALGLNEPVLLPAVPVAIFSVLTVLAYDGLRENA